MDNNAAGLEVFFRFLSGPASVNITFLVISLPPCCCDLIPVAYLTGGVSDSHLPLRHAAGAPGTRHHPSGSGPGNHLLPQTQHQSPGGPTGTEKAHRLGVYSVWEFFLAALTGRIAAASGGRLGLTLEARFCLVCS